MPKSEPKPQGRFTEVVFAKTIQKSDYEPERIELKYQLAEGEDVEEAWKFVREMGLYLITNED